MVSLPTGVVTFCFTDVEGSTRLARELGPSWSALLGRHNALLREVWAKHGGVEVKTEGDSFFVVFAAANQALAAALGAQRALAEQQLGLRVRIGLHTGEAELAGADYVGLEVHKAARVADAAHGGQVLISAATAALAQPSEGADLEDLGLFSLRGFDEPERLMRLRHPDLPKSDAAPRVAPAAAHNLPLLRSSFLGRERDVEELVQLCELEALVTVLGPGGAGKTRIALETGRRLARGDADGVWAVLLAGEPAGSDIAPVVARTLGVADVPGQTVRDTIVEHLRSKHLLLILDNCEHVTASAAQLCDQVLRNCPRVHVLVTSRQPLGIDGERVWELPALSLPPREGADVASVLATSAGGLFVERARAAAPSFRLTEDNAADVAALCLALDGLPLALELAAATTRAVPLPRLLARLEAGTVRLRSTNPTHPQRQRTVEDLIGWSYKLLDDVQAAVFRRLAVFRGGWTLEAAEEVCQGGIVGQEDVLPALMDLVQRSLVSVEGDDRYRMLVLIGGYARALDTHPDERAEADAAHLRFYGRLAEQVMLQLNTPEGLRAVREEPDNLAAAGAAALACEDVDSALAITMSLASSLLHAGHYTESNALLLSLEPALAQRTEQLLRVWANRTQLLRVLGRFEECLALCEATMELADREGNEPYGAFAAKEKAELLASQGRHDEVLTLVRERLSVVSTPRARASFLERLALALDALGDKRGAVAAAAESADLFDLSGEPLQAATVRGQMAWLWACLGDVERAIAAVENLLLLAKEAEAPRLRVQGIVAGAAVKRWALFRGFPEQLLTRLPSHWSALDEALSAAIGMGEAHLIINVHLERALKHLFEGLPDRAARELADLVPSLREARHDAAASVVVTIAAIRDSQAAGTHAAKLAATAIALDPEDDMIRTLLEPLAAGTPLGRDDALDLVEQLWAADPP